MEQLVAPFAEHDQIVDALVAVPLVGVVVHVQARVSLSAQLAAIPCARERLLRCIERRGTKQDTRQPEPSKVKQAAGMSAEVLLLA